VRWLEHGDAGKGTLEVVAQLLAGGASGVGHRSDHEICPCGKAIEQGKGHRT
jgi:hypothetical protein